jgi:hypothetical protein
MTTGVKAAAIAAALGRVRRGRDRRGRDHRRGARARGSDCGHPLGRRGRTRRTLRGSRSAAARKLRAFFAAKCRVPAASAQNLTPTHDESATRRCP